MKTYLPGKDVPLTGAPYPQVNAATPKQSDGKQRILLISVISVLVAVVISLVSKLLVWLINLVTNLAFFGHFSLDYNSPAGNHLGAWVILVPAAGGLIIGFMAVFGSKAIRGHGIPEAMEMVLVNESRIHPKMTFLKPLSAAIAMGTGGPFGAEGPIIATGGALGSTIGQLFSITPNERKILLAAGGTAGMSAIFGTPVAAIFLGIELLLFEFSPRSIIPVALACITGAAGHQLLFESGPSFPMADLASPSDSGLAVYSLIGLVIGFLSLGLTKTVFLFEDWFEKIPLHWMWWPAIGGLGVGLAGWVSPHTLGVGYDNITGLLTGSLPMGIMLSLCIFKFLSWAVALGSGTSGGTLAPIMTIGGAAGGLMGLMAIHFFPAAGILVSFSVLVGLAAMFAGASRAFMTSIIFALEATQQSHALLPLLGACTAAYLVSFFLMKNTIMTEKIVRSGVILPDSYEPDMLLKIRVQDAISAEALILSAQNTIGEVIRWFKENPAPVSNYSVVVSSNGNLLGIIRITDIFLGEIDAEKGIDTLIFNKPLPLEADSNLRHAVNRMSESGVEILPVVSAGNPELVTGVLTYKDIIRASQVRTKENLQGGAHISLKRQRIRILIRGRKLVHHESRP